MTEKDSDTRKAGRGLLSITGAKILFILTSYSVQLVLPRLLGSPESFGLYAAAMNLASILNNVLIATTVQTVSKLVSENERSAAASLRQSLGFQLAFGGTLAALVYVSAPWIARDLLLDRALEPLLKAAAVVVFSYALYAALVGSLNGRHLFQKQAALDATFSCLRTTGILGGAALAGAGILSMDSALGAVSGFASAAVSILLVALVVVGVGQPGRGFELKRLLAFMTPLLLYQVCLNGMLQVDLAVLKRSVAELAMADGLGATEAADVASRYSGYYRAAQTFAFVPYQLILSMTFIVFPSISRATTQGDDERTRVTIRQSMRFSLLVLLLVAAPIAGGADGVMRIAYPEDYLAGSEALSVLVLAMVNFALFVIAATILSGSGRPLSSFVVSLVGLVALVVANRWFLMSEPLGESTLVAAATGTAIGTTLAFALVAILVLRQFGALLPLGTIARGLLAAGAAFFAARFVPHDTRVWALVSLATGAATFGVTLTILGEITRRDLDALRAIVRR